MPRILTSLLVLAACGTAGASPILTLTPASGSLSGWPGSDIGWGFSLTSDSALWVSVVTSSLTGESNPALGTYTDFIGAEGGPVNAVLAPGALPWTQTFDFASQAGVGAFSIDSGAEVGSSDSGTLDVQYETFSADPNRCGDCSVGFADATTPFSVQVTSTPEPGTLGCMAVCILIWILSGSPRGISRIIPAAAGESRIGAEKT